MLILQEAPRWIGDLVISTEADVDEEAWSDWDAQSGPWNDFAVLLPTELRFLGGLVSIDLPGRSKNRARPVALVGWEGVDPARAERPGKFASPSKTKV